MREVRGGAGEAEVEERGRERRVRQRGRVHKRPKAPGFAQVVVLKARRGAAAGKRRVGDRAAFAFPAAVAAVEQQAPAEVGREELVGHAVLAAAV